MQAGGLLRDLTVRETVQLTATLFPEARPVHEVMRRAGIEDVAGRLAGKCSGDEQQRLRFALALLPDPALMVLDEPTAGMDVEGRRDFWTAIRDDASRGRTVLFATHYLEEADSYADRIILLRHGRVVADGTAAEVRSLSEGRSVEARLPGADATPGVWIASGLLAWAGALVFASFGLFMGYLLPSENVMQIIGPILAAFVFFGGLFVPLALLGSPIEDLAPYTPAFGVAEIARFPLLGGNFDWTWLLNVVLWIAAFGAGSAILFRRDTRRA